MGIAFCQDLMDWWWGPVGPLLLGLNPRCPSPSWIRPLKGLSSITLTLVSLVKLDFFMAAGDMKAGARLTQHPC